MSQIVTLKSKMGEAKAIVKDPREHLQRFWMEGRFYEAGMLEYIQQNYSGGVFVDCGSCIGNHTLFFAKFCNPKLVISIEPVEPSLRHQTEVLRLNNLLDKVYLHCGAVGVKDNSGNMRFFGDQKPRNIGMMRLHMGRGLTHVRALDSILTDSSLRDIPDVTLVKIDVEYHELEVLKGATRLLSEQSPVLFIELVDENYEEVVTFLERFGYHPTGKCFNASPTYEFVKEN